MTERAAALLELLARELTLRRELEVLERDTTRGFRALEPFERAQVCEQLGLLNVPSTARGIEG